MLNRFSISYRSVCLAIWLLNCTIPLSKIIIALAFIGKFSRLVRPQCDIDIWQDIHFDVNIVLVS